MVLSVCCYFQRLITPLRAVKNPSVLPLSHNLSMRRRCIHPSILKIFFPYCCHIQWQSLGNSCPTKISLSHQLKSVKETVLKPSPCHPFSSYSHPLLTPSLFFLFSSKETAWVSDQIHILTPTFPRSGSSLIFSTPRCQSHKLQWKIHNSCLSVVGGLSHTILGTYLI